MQGRVTALEEEKQGLEARMKAELDQEKRESKTALHAAERKLADLEAQLKNGPSADVNRPTAGKQPPAMAAPGAKPFSHYKYHT